MLALLNLESVFITPVLTAVLQLATRCPIMSAVADVMEASSRLKDVNRLNSVPRKVYPQLKPVTGVSVEILPVPKLVSRLRPPIHAPEPSRERQPVTVATVPNQTDQTSEYAARPIDRSYPQRKSLVGSTMPSRLSEYLDLVLCV